MGCCCCNSKCVKFGLVILIAYITYCFLREDNSDDLFGTLHGKNVVVTGASSGIGEQAALFYASQGASVVLMARRENLLKEITKKCRDISPLPGSTKFKYIVVDFNDLEKSEAAMKEAIHYLGSIEYLMLNHAYLLSQPDVVQRWTGSAKQLETMQLSINTNFLSFVRMAGVALPHLKESSGSICVISSFMVEIPAFSIPYATTKAAINTFFSGLRQELIHEKSNVSVTVVHLGLVQTGHTKDSLSSMSLAQGRDMTAVTSVLPPTAADTCAKDLVRVTVRRESEVYYPYNQHLWALRVLRLLITDADARMRSMEDFFTAVLTTTKSFGF